MPGSTLKQSRLITTAFIAWLVAGTLDALAAIYILGGGNAKIIFQYIASAVYGKAAFSGGGHMVLMGVLFHYFIAGCATAFYFIIYPYIPLFKKSKIASIIIYAIFTWCVTNLLVLPFTKLRHHPFNPLSALENVVILMFTIGLPLTMLRYWYEKRKTHN